VVVCREDLATEKVIAYARKGRFAKAAFEAIRAETGSRRATAELLIRLKYPRLLHFDGSPYGRLRGPAGMYFRYRYSVPNVPSIIGILSCLRRTASKGGYLLDIGAGFGHFYRYFLHSYPAEKIVLLDHSLEALLTASRFIDPRSLLVCADAEKTLPFDKGMFSDITSFNAFQYLKEKERFLQSAIDGLDRDTGTLWLSNNWNFKLTDQFFGPARSPSEWRAFCKSEKWRIFPERHFADPVLRGGLVNLAVQYLPQDEHPNWRCVTLAYSNAPWAANNKFVPLNRAPKYQHLHYNSLYYRSAFRNRLIKRKVTIKFWESHRDYFGFHLPEMINLPGRIDRRTGRGMQALAESLVMVEPLCPRRRPIASEIVSSVLTRIREGLGSIIYQCGLQDALKPLLPRAVKATAKRFFDLQRTTY
jgi:SAM-dependent methyltransferase